MGSFPRMRHPVSLHVTFSIEAAATVGALVRPFPRVDSQVQSQRSALSEVHATFLTPVRLLSCVDSHVVLQMARLFKTFGAHGTSVPSLPGEIVHVSLRSKTFSSFTAQVGVWPFLLPCWRACFSPFSIHSHFCILTIFTLIYRVKGLRGSGRSGQVAACCFSTSPLPPCCVQSLVVAGA